jgi:cyclopropane fatty-acyl-phospholipid synthase-like methyltransferase
MAIERITPDHFTEWRSMGLHHLQRYEFAARFTDRKGVLDMACGNGYGAFTLMNLGARSVTAVDLDPKAVGYAQTHYSRPGLTFQCANCFEFPAKQGGYETIVSFETIEHLDKPDRFIHKLRELISIDGQLIISAPNTLRYKHAANPIENPFHLNEPTYEGLKSWLASSFIVDQEWEQSPITLGFERQLALLANSTFARWMLNLERFGKRLARRPSVAAIDLRMALQESCLHMTTQIFPLLPERRDSADVFLFVCRPRQ